MSNPHPVLGNGQHVGVAALVLAAALLSIELWDEPTPAKPLGLCDRSNMSAEEIQQQARILNILYCVIGRRLLCNSLTLLWLCQCRCRRIFQRCTLALTMSLSKMQVSSGPCACLMMVRACMISQNHFLLTPGRRKISPSRCYPWVSSVLRAFLIRILIFILKQHIIYIYVCVLDVRPELKKKCLDAHLKTTGNISDLKARLMEKCIHSVDKDCDSYLDVSVCLCLRVWICVGTNCTNARITCEDKGISFFPASSSSAEKQAIKCFCYIYFWGQYWSKDTLDPMVFFFSRWELLASQFRTGSGSVERCSSTCGGISFTSCFPVGLTGDVQLPNSQHMAGDTLGICRGILQVIGGNMEVTGRSEKPFNKKTAWTLSGKSLAVLQRSEDDAAGDPESKVAWCIICMYMFFCMMYHIYIYDICVNHQLFQCRLTYSATARRKLTNLWFLMWIFASRILLLLPKRLRRWRTVKSQHMVSNRSLLFNLFWSSHDAVWQQETTVLKAAGQHAEALLFIYIVWLLVRKMKRKLWTEQRRWRSSEKSRTPASNTEQVLNV